MERLFTCYKGFTIDVINKKHGVVVESYLVYGTQDKEDEIELKVSEIVNKLELIYPKPVFDVIALELREVTLGDIALYNSFGHAILVK